MGDEGKNRTENEVTRAGPGQTHCDTLATPTYYVLVDRYTKEPDDSLTLTEQVYDPANARVVHKSTTSVKSTSKGEGTSDDRGVLVLSFDEDTKGRPFFRTDRGQVTLTIKRGKFDRVLLQDKAVPCFHEKAGTNGPWRGVAHELPAPSPEAKDPVLRGARIDYSTLEADEAKVE